MGAKGFLLVIADDEATLRFLGYDGNEGHARSHALRDALARGGVWTSIVAPEARDERTERARAKEGSE